MESPKKNIYNSNDKLKWWGYGEWVEEEDEFYFIYKDFECFVKRVVIKEKENEDERFGGHFCGYVTLPKNIDQNSLDVELIDCHGGITYYENDMIVFDCAHTFDITPSMVKRFNGLFESLFRDIFYNLNPDLTLDEQHLENMKYKITYKNMNFCIDECKKIVDQILDIGIKHES